VVVALFQRLRLPVIRKVDAREARVLQEQMQVCASQRAQHLLNYKELVDLRLSGEEGPAVADLPQNAAQRPHVDARPVAGRANEQLWGTVPARRHIVGEWLRVNAHVPCKPEIAEFERVVYRIDQQILRFDVPVKDILAVAILERIC
jgi:hypothetical protein